MIRLFLAHAIELFNEDVWDNKIRKQHNYIKKTALRKYARWLVKSRASIKQLDYELEISIAW